MMMMWGFMSSVVGVDKAVLDDDDVGLHVLSCRVDKAVLDDDDVGLHVLSCRADKAVLVSHHSLYIYMWVVNCMHSCIALIIVLCYSRCKLSPVGSCPFSYGKAS